MSGFPLYSVVEESRCRLSEGGSGTCPFLDLFSFFNPGDSHTHRSAIVQLKPLYAWRSRAAGVYQPSNTASNHTNTHACMFAHRCAKLSDAQTRNSRPLLSAVCASTSSLLYACRPRASAGIQLLESRSLPPRLALVSFRLVIGHIDTYTWK